MGKKLFEFLDEISSSHPSLNSSGRGKEVTTARRLAEDTWEDCLDEIAERKVQIIEDALKKYADEKAEEAVRKCAEISLKHRCLICRAGCTICAEEILNLLKKNEFMPEIKTDSNLKPGQWLLKQKKESDGK